ncbi:hypothetical protein MPSEU_000200500 [Mayamaea pseudoterrestris]|nr:hypothetical protein MPSEU_000200500 [Mayamaea pseudoterrestris]
MNESSLHLILYIALFCCSLIASEAQVYEGKFIVASVVNRTGHEVELPSKRYLFQMQHATDEQDGSVYAFSFNITNNFRGDFVVDEQNGSVESVRSVISTRQFPPEAQGNVERAMSSILRSMKKIKMKKQRSLILRGAEGTITLNRRRNKK